MRAQSPASISQGLQELCRLQKTDTPDQAIRGACTHLLALGGIKEPPIALKPLLGILGVGFKRSVSYWKPGQGAASLHAHDGKLEVLVHERDFKRNWRRNRFTIAHEIVHALILRTLDNPFLVATLDEDEESHRELERVCNVGAAELLMPTAMVRAGIKEFGLGPDGLDALYDRFLVSRQALIWQLALTMPLGSAVRWRKLARAPQEEKCYRVVSCYPSYSPTGERPWLPKGTTTKHVSSDIVERVGDSGSTELEEEATIDVGGRAWKCCLYGTFFPPRAERLARPAVFDGFPIPDEPTSTWMADILTFSAKRGFSIPGGAEEPT